jgi:hypothetical protein
MGDLGLDGRIIIIKWIFKCILGEGVGRVNLIGDLVWGRRG